MHIGRALTLAPGVPARAVEAPQIRELLSLRTGRFLNAPSLIRRHRYDRIIRLRNMLLEAMRSRRPRLVCSLCRVPAYLVSSKDKAFFFRHAEEDGSCPAVTRDFPEMDLRARKYAGLAESEPHRRLKRLLMRSISADPAFADGAEETHWRAPVPRLGPRRPDVSATFNGLRLAFEAQLSTTFLSVIVGRRAFYRAEGALLVWVLASFDPRHRRLPEDDIVFPNNSNALVVDEETAAQSEAFGRFRIRCWHPVAGAEDWRSAIVDFSELTLDTVEQRAFLIDVAAEDAARRAKAQAEERLAKAAAREAEDALRSARDDALRRDFIDYWRSPWESRGGFEQRLAAWADFHARFTALSVRFPTYAGDADLERWMRMVITAQTGAPEGWNYRTLPELAHHLHDQFPGRLLPFFRMLNHYGHAETLKSQDVTGNWGAKAKRTADEIRSGSTRYATVCEWDELLAFLFPNLFHVFFRIS